MNKKLAFSLIELSIVILIIGILVAGVTQSSRLVAQMRLASAQSVTRSADISSIRDMVFWAETSLESSITNSAGSLQIEDGNSVSSWNDINPQISAKINVTQATVANQPIYKALGINGLPSLSFNGTSNLLQNTTTMPISASDKDYTYVAVWRSTSGGMVLSQGIPGSNPNRLSSITVGSSSYGFAGDMNDFISPSVQSNTSYITVMTINNNLTTNNISIYTNSNTPSLGTTSGGSASLNIGGSAFVIGGRLSESFFSGLISEVIVFDRNLKTDEVKSVNAYLSKKYSIKIP